MAMLLNHFHHDNGLADAGAAEHAHLAATGKRHQQVDDLYAGLEHVDLNVLLGELRAPDDESASFFPG
jgi:hypothetical protein